MGPWVAGESEGTDAPLIKGAKASGTAQLSKLLPNGKIPLTIDGILNSSMGTKPALEGARLVQAYVGGSLSFTRFVKEWHSVIRSGAIGFARANHIDVKKYIK